VFCWGLRGLAVIESCNVAGIDVPFQIAVLSGDYDDLLCETATPPLSGIQTPSELIGQRAASPLNRLMAKKKPPTDTIHVLPTRVIERGSSAILAIDDPDLAASLRYIREHASDPIGVEDVLDHVPCSRKSLERKFEQVLRRTPASEIRRVHLERACQLLLETDLPIPRVATSSDFGSGDYMTRAFKVAMEVTPLRYRSQMRARNEAC